MITGRLIYDEVYYYYMVDLIVAILIKILSGALLFFPKKVINIINLKSFNLVFISVIH